MKKVTMQTIADTLGISRVSVWKVMNSQSGVSDAMRKNILDTATRLGYYMADSVSPSYPHSSPEDMPTISVAVSRPETSAFWMNIIHSIAKDMGDMGYNLLYTYLPSECTSSYTFPSTFNSKNINAVIVLNVYDKIMLDMLGKSNIPTIFLDWVPGMSLQHVPGDLILLEGSDTIYRITKSMIKQGCSRIGFIGDIHYALTNAERYGGFTKALRDCGLSDDVSTDLTGYMGITDYKKEISDFLSSLPSLPDAFVCSNDYIARITLDRLTAMGVRVPEDVLLSGYDGSNEFFSNKDFLTTALVDNSQLGHRLIDQARYRITYPDAPFEITHIIPEIRYGRSTRKNPDFS